MIIDLQKNQLCIKNIALQSYQVSQLKFWEFKSTDENTLEYSGEDVEKVLIKVLNYFQKVKINFEISEDCSKIINEVLLKENEFKKTKKLGLDFKNGIYDRKLFIDFSNYLSAHLSRKLKKHQFKSA